MPVGCGPAFKIPPTPSYILKLLREERIRNQMSLEALSLLTGYNFNSLQRWENGRVTPSVNAVVDYANALGFDLVLRKKE